METLSPCRARVLFPFAFDKRSEEAVPPRDAEAEAAALKLFADTVDEREAGQAGDKASDSCEPALADRARQDLLEIARLSLKKESDRKRFAEDTQRFAARAAQDGLSCAEVTETYRQVARLFAAVPGAAIEDRSAIACQVMRQASDPETIDQGQHQTCNVAVLEVRLYSRMPSRAAGLVADIATANAYTTADGTRISLHRDSLKADNEARHNPARDGQRSHASQLFQIAAANIHWLRAKRDYGGRAISPGSMGAVQLSDKRGMAFGPDNSGLVFDTGERLVDLAHSPPQAVRRDFGIRIGYLQGIGEQISGQDEPAFVIENKHLGAVSADSHEPVSEHVSSPAELRDALARHENAGNMPVIMRIHPGNHPFNQQGSSWHTVNIMSYDPIRNRARLSNQWGDGSDSWIDVKTLYRATLPPEKAPQILLDPPARLQPQGLP